MLIIILMPAGKTNQCRAKAGKGQRKAKEGPR
jgi:hypothetical protein